MDRIQSKEEKNMKVTDAALAEFFGISHRTMSTLRNGGIEQRRRYTAYRAYYLAAS